MGNTIIGTIKLSRTYKLLACKKNELLQIAVFIWHEEINRYTDLIPSDDFIYTFHWEIQQCIQTEYL